MSSKCIDFLYVIKSIIVNDCFVICVGLSLLSKTVDMTSVPNKGLEPTTLGLRPYDTLNQTPKTAFAKEPYNHVQTVRKCP